MIGATEFCNLIENYINKYNIKQDSEGLNLPALFKCAYYNIDLSLRYYNQFKRSVEFKHDNYLTYRFRWIHGFSTFRHLVLEYRNIHSEVKIITIIMDAVVKDYICFTYTGLKYGLK